MMCLAYAILQTSVKRIQVLGNHKSRVVSMSDDSLLRAPASLGMSLNSSTVGKFFGSCSRKNTPTYITAFYSGLQKQRYDGDVEITLATRKLLWIHLRANSGPVKWISTCYSENLVRALVSNSSFCQCPPLASSRIVKVLIKDEYGYHLSIKWGLSARHRHRGS